ncbi:MnhB domain-containing protein [Hyphomicrobium sp.]|uniref:MnhB domain-containing protein n=1 Tax=Hyphomicrobium sp. TaxID=82 RepID=UPI002CB5D2FC|nr:MnhB domain-containing protein [Hyphomicrobium sp.]HRQ27855.1 MnhB domain-containing protein [Hyphomicrobium sp.]
MNSLILKTSGRVILPLAILFSVYVLFRGHNEPGGGFIGGLIAAAGLAVYALPRGRSALVGLIRVWPKVLIGGGLALGLLSGLPALLLDSPYLTHQWTFPGGLAVGTALVFDVGVYLTVVGAVLTFLLPYLED